METLGLNITDWAIVIVLIASGLMSLSRGFTKEFLSLFLWFFSFIAALSLGHLATPKVSTIIGNEEIAKIISYVLIFILFIVGGSFLIKFISKLVRWSGASGFDRFLGVLFGFMRGLILIFVVFLLLPGSFKQSDLYMNSKISPLIDEYAPRVEEYFNDLISDKDIVEEATNLIEPLVEDTQNLIEEVSDTQEEENS
jgi:membrane protein required for colicin V production